MAPEKVICLRHAEKPANAEKKDRWRRVGQEGPGLDASGGRTRHGLTLKGWQRASALAATDLCGLAREDPHSPVTIFVPDYGDDATPRRPGLTMLPFALRRGVEPAPVAPKDEVDKLHDEVTTAEGVVVVCWEHKALVKFLQTFVTWHVKWPGNRFDVLWVLDPEETDEKERLERTEQRLLAGDCGLA